MVVKPEKKSERDIKRESGAAEGGERTVIAQTEAFHPQAVFKRCRVRDPVIMAIVPSSSCCDHKLSFTCNFSSNKSNI